MEPPGAVPMDEASIIQYITRTFDNVRVVDAWGDRFFYYNPDRNQPDEIYFATLKSQGDEYDNISNLNRPSVFRLNIGIGKTTFQSLFGDQVRPSAREIDTSYDYTSLDQLLPHPVYGRMHWVCVLNPSEVTFQAVQPLLAEAYALAVEKYAKRTARR